MRHRSRLVVLLIGLAALLVAVGWFGLRSTSARTDIAARRSLYGAVPVFPGAVKIDETSYEIKEDGRGTGDHGLRVVYRIPAETSSSDVLTFLKSNVPAGWTEASDDLCARLSGQSSPATTKLMNRRSKFTIFEDGHDTLNAGAVSGVTFRLSGSGQQKSLTLDEPEIGCQLADHPDDDIAADLFDAK